MLERESEREREGFDKGYAHNYEVSMRCTKYPHHNVNIYSFFLGERILASVFGSN